MLCQYFWLKCLFLDKEYQNIILNFLYVRWYEIANCSPKATFIWEFYRSCLFTNLYRPRLLSTSKGQVCKCILVSSVERKFIKINLNFYIWLTIFKIVAYHYDIIFNIYSCEIGSYTNHRSYILSALKQYHKYQSVLQSMSTFFKANTQNWKMFNMSGIFLKYSS